MTKEKSSHAERIGRKKQNRSLRVLASDSNESWPANLGELLQWYTYEVEDVTRAAQLRLRDSAKVIEDYRHGKIGFDEARERVSNHDMKWGQIFPGGVDAETRGMSDEEIHNAIERAKRERNTRYGEGRG